MVSASGNCDFTLSASGTYSVHLVPNGLFAASFNVLLNQDLTATLTAGTPGPTVNVGLIPGQHGLLHFSATAGQTVALYVAPVIITPSNSILTATVYGPTGAYVTSTNVTGSASGTFNLTNLAAGSYSVLLAPNNASASGASTQVALANGVTVALPVNGSSSAFQTYLPGQNGYFTFAATAGQNLGFGLTQLALTPASVAYASTSIATPNGTSLTSATCYTSASPGCELSTRNLPLTGTYTVTVSPGGQATMAAALTLSQDAGGTLTLNNASSIALSAPGEAADFTFTVASQQAVLLNVGSISTSPAGTALIFYIYDSNNNLVTQASLTQSGSVNIGNVAAGTYTVLVVPNSAATANIQVTLQPAATGTLPANGVSTNFGTTAPGQDAYLTFAGTVGQSVSLALTGMSLTPSSISSATVTVKKPDGTLLTSTSCSAANVGCELHLANLPQAGSYSVTVAPGGQATMNFAATLSPDVTGTLASGTAFNVGLTFVGQSATLSFVQASQQTMALDLGSISTTPANATLNVYVYNSSGTLVNSGSTISGTGLNLTNLAVGNYTVQVIPQYPLAGALQVTLTPAFGGVLSPTSTGSGTSYSSPEPGQNIYFSFSGTAGQSVSLALTGFSLTNGVSYATVIVTTTGNSNVGSLYCYNSTSCELHVRNLPVTGTYTVSVLPSGQGVMNFTATLSQDVTATLSPGAGSTVNLAAEGQSATLTFTLTSQQTVALNISSITTTPANQYLTATVYNASNTNLTSTSPNTSSTLNLVNYAAGTYTVVVTTSGAPLTGSFQMVIEPSVGGALSLTSSGAGATPYSTPVPGQNAYFTFSGTAGQSLSLALSGFSLSNGVSYATVIVATPSNSTVTSANCSNSTGCDLHLRNLPVTGTYTVSVTPSGMGAMTFTPTLSLDATATLSPGTATTVNLLTLGQSATLTFTLTSQQTVALNISSIATTPANQYLTATVYNASNTNLTSTSPNTSSTLNLVNYAAGTYTVVVTTSGAPLTGSFQMVIEPSVGGALSLTSSGAGATTLAPRYPARMPTSFFQARRDKACRWR